MLTTEGDVLASPPGHIFLQGGRQFLPEETCPPPIPPPLRTLLKTRPFEEVRGHAARKFFAKFHFKTRIFVHSRGTFGIMLAGYPSPHPSLRP